ncbi:hypothetical protein [Desulfonatronospira sp.]|uniref:hypothetical protein n=1 Tax=Desulfonatronospira sp. TaxID=1962951 RepID=UPI0025BD69B9|nr:hypothetical protein [Desulfonatronospira sp.]
MFCTKCSYTSFDHLTSCPKCGYDWGAQRRIFNLEWIQAPGDAWMLSGQDNESAEPEVFGDFVREEGGVEVSGRTVEEDIYQPVKSHDIENVPEYSQDMSREPDFDVLKDPGASSTGKGARREDEIEFPDLEISYPDSNKK